MSIARVSLPDECAHKLSSHQPLSVPNPLSPWVRVIFLTESSFLSEVCRGLPQRLAVSRALRCWDSGKRSKTSAKRDVYLPALSLKLCFVARRCRCECGFKIDATFTKWFEMPSSGVPFWLWGFVLEAQPRQYSKLLGSACKVRYKSFGKGDIFYL